MSMGLSPSMVRTCSITSAVRMRFARSGLPIGGTLGMPLRAAVWLSVNSSNVKWGVSSVILLLPGRRRLLGSGGLITLIKPFEVGLIIHICRIKGNERLILVTLDHTFVGLVVYGIPNLCVGHVS